MRRVRILIRYYNEEGEIVFEDVPTLGHAYRVPVQWTRWEIYWDEVLMEAGERPAAADAGEETNPGGQGGQGGQEQAGYRRATNHASPRGRRSRSGTDFASIVSWAHGAP